MEALITNLSAADPLLLGVMVWVAKHTISRIDALEKHSNAHNVRLTVLEKLFGSSK